MNARVDGAFGVCMQSALDEVGVWVPQWMTALNEGLRQRESSASSFNEKQVYLQSRTVLANYKTRISSRFVEELSEVIHGVQSVEVAEPEARKVQTLSLDDLELMDHDQVQGTVEMARVQQIVRMAVDEELVAFTARLCAARGMSAVKTDTNPLRPDVVVEALSRVLGSLHLDESVRTRWLHSGAVPLGKALQQFYASLTHLLERLGVQPAGYSVVQAPTPRSTAAQVQAANTEPGRTESVPVSSVPSTSDEDPVLTLDHLHQLLQGNLDNGGDAVTDQGTSGSGNAMVRTLAAEVVTLMMRRMAEDTRLLRTVRDLVQGIKPVLLQVARTNPRFFADRENPARRLLDAISSQGLAFTNEQDPGYSEYAELTGRVIGALKLAKVDLPERIGAALQRYMAQIKAQPSRRQGLAMETLAKVEQRNLLAERVAGEMRARNDYPRAPGVVRRFLTGPWAQVVAHARLDLSATRVDPNAGSRYMDILADLLWSSQLAQASRNRARLIRVASVVLRTLREGLDSIDYPREASEAFFQALMGLHEAAYRTQRSDADDRSLDSRLPSVDAGLWMHASEAKESGFMEDAFILEQPVFEDTQPMSRDGLPEEASALVTSMDQLHPGAWFDLREDQNLTRCQLTWSSPHGTLFLFTGPGQRSISLTQRGAERMIALGRLRVVADHGLVQDALDAVARQALLSSGQA
ncbi:DUF1631 family protein [Hydrogenophaga sp. PAMC20947]|uniref:DUF1631 family protein n=1 Tax=Hydrogenophaga sp. PAMC20947 TaxID=2565558 RepID=UPI00109DC103|nr:DUF1631 family protein [Hydrogenophaga sp. PAMC20947]QCB46036.1 DUF1631 family protein [Hydrogenophaga sp. PAMC20947]